MGATVGLIGSVVGIMGGVKTLLSSGDNEPSPPPIKPVTPMPLPDDKAALQARRRSLAMQSATSGRASTILTNQSETLGS